MRFVWIALTFAPTFGTPSTHSGRRVPTSRLSSTPTCWLTSPSRQVRGPSVYAVPSGFAFGSIGCFDQSPASASANIHIPSISPPFGGPTHEHVAAERPRRQGAPRLLQRPMDVSREFTEIVKIWLAGGAMLLALLWVWIPKRVAQNALVALTLVAGANYARWGPDSSTWRVDAYDVLHYYINAKYFDELGYYDLYPAIILADVENGGPFFKGQGDKYMAQDAAGHAIQPISHGVARGRVVKQGFAPERWQQFTHDVLYLQREVGCRVKLPNGACTVELNDELWRQMLQDHGFNGTTAWTVLAEPIAQVVPVEGIKWLGYIDVVLLAAGLALVAWAYGGTAAAFTAIWFLVGYTQRWPYLSWVFLRYDWVFALMAAAALLRKGQPLLAGVFAGWSATLRMFPAMWMWGPLAKGLAGLSKRHVSRPLLVLAGGFLLGVGAVEGYYKVIKI